MAKSSRLTSGSALPMWFRYINTNICTHIFFDSIILWIAPIVESFMSKSSVCFQDDILMGTLSVRENLLFSANLRLSPKHHSSADKKSRVDAIIQDLGLTDCADTKV